MSLFFQDAEIARKRRRVEEGKAPESDEEPTMANESDSEGEPPM